MSTAKKIAYIIAGPNGCGKSTVAKELIGEADIPFVNADDIAAAIAENGNVEAVRLSAGKEFFRLLDEYMSSGRSFALETTLSGKYLVAVIEKLKKLNYAVNIKYIYVANSNEAISRIRCRVMAGGHHIPDQDVVRRFWRSTHNFWYLYKDISNWWSMYLNDTTDLILVAAKTEEGFDIVENRHFEDFKKLL